MAQLKRLIKICQKGPSPLAQKKGKIENESISIKLWEFIFKIPID